MKITSTKKSRKNMKPPYFSYALFFILGMAISSAVFFGLVMPQIKDAATRYMAYEAAIQEDTSTDEQTNGQQIPEHEIVSEEQDSDTDQSIKSDAVTKSMPIVAVHLGSEEGVIGNVTVKVVPGTSSVLVDTEHFVEPDLQLSMNIAVEVAKELTGEDAESKDYILEYSVPATVVGGASAGAATTIAVLAALENKTINEDAIMTGTIEPDGSIGPVGGVLEKAKVAADMGYKTFVVPEGQAEITEYERVSEEADLPAGTRIYNRRYIQHTIDIEDELNGSIDIVEVENIEDAKKIFFE